MGYYEKKGLKVHRYNTPFVQQIDTEKKVTVIKAYLGKGKTAECIRVCRELLDKKPDARILVFSPRETFAWNIAQEYSSGVDVDFMCYKSVDSGFDFSEYPFFVCQMESLWRLRKNFHPYDVLILDESEACLTQTTSFNTQKKKMLVPNDKMFEELILSSERLICADAFLSQKTLHTLDEFGLLEDTNLYVNESQPEARKCVEITGEKSTVVKQKFISAIAGDLRAGKNLYIFCPSCKFAEQIVENVCFDGEDEIVSHVLYSKAMSPEVKSSLRNVREVWKSKQLVITTPTITVGVNFDLKHFHKAYVYGSAWSCPVRDVFQGLMRSRHLIDNELRYAVCEKVGVLYKPVSMAEYRETEEMEKRIIKQLLEHMEPNLYKKIPVWFHTVVQFVEVEKNLNERYYREMFEMYLKLCNYTKEENEDANVERICELKVSSSCTPLYSTVKLHESLDDLNKKLDQDALDENDLYMLKKHQFLKKIRVEEDDEREETEKVADGTES